MQYCNANFWQHVAWSCPHIQSAVSTFQIRGQRLWSAVCPAAKYVETTIEGSGASAAVTKGYTVSSAHLLVSDCTISLGNCQVLCYEMWCGCRDYSDTFLATMWTMRKLTWPHLSSSLKDQVMGLSLLKRTIQLPFTCLSSFRYDRNGVCF